MNEILLASESAGKPVEVECARSGKFHTAGGRVFEAGPSELAELATAFDPADDHLCRIGHRPLETSDPDYGRVIGLRYDAGADRLLAKIIPEPALIEANRRSGFRRVSMELVPAGGRLKFTHLAFLGAMKPAISGLRPVLLAARDGSPADLHFAMAESIGLNPTVIFARSALHDRTLLCLAAMREHEPETTYTAALEIVAEIEAAELRRSEG